MRARWLAAALLLSTSAAARAATPAVNYALHCQGCHLADGRETPGLVPKLTGTMSQFAAIPEGRAYLVRLPNIVSAPLSADDMARLLNWLVVRFDEEGPPRGTQPVAFTSAEVSSGREHPLIDIETARRAVLIELEQSAVRVTPAGLQSAPPGAENPNGGSASRPLVVGSP